jgi:hypothetical protein
MWVNNFAGQGFSNSVSVAGYGSFTQSNFYVDALVGYANYSNWLNRSIIIPGLSPRVATGSTSANQVLGQAEAGYKSTCSRRRTPASPRSACSRVRA